MCWAQETHESSLTKSPSPSSVSGLFDSKKQKLTLAHPKPFFFFLRKKNDLEIGEVIVLRKTEDLGP